MWRRLYGISFCCRGTRSGRGRVLHAAVRMRTASPGSRRIKHQNNSTIHLGGRISRRPPPPHPCRSLFCRPYPYTPAGNAQPLCWQARLEAHQDAASWRQVVGLLHYPGPPARSSHDAAGQISNRPDQRLAAWASVSQRRRPLLRRLSVSCRLLSIAASSCRSRRPEAWIPA